MSKVMSEDSCRVCLKSKSKDLKTSIFDNSDDNLTIADKIMMCGDVKVIIILFFIISLILIHG